eukprot:2615306-Pleurochrysis_carterae.AAC.2
MNAAVKGKNRSTCLPTGCDDGKAAHARKKAAALTSFSCMTDRSRCSDRVNSAASRAGGLPPPPAPSLPPP